MILLLCAVLIVGAVLLAGRHNAQRRHTEWEQFGLVYGPRNRISLEESDRAWNRYMELDALQYERESRGDWGSDK